MPTQQEHAAARRESHWLTAGQLEGRVPRPYGPSCYLVAAYMAQRAQQPFLYVGESVSPVKRLLQHWGVLKRGAKETKGYGLELFHVCVVTGFAEGADHQRKWLALLFEALWQGSTRVSVLVEKHLRHSRFGGRHVNPNLDHVLARVQQLAFPRRCLDRSSRTLLRLALLARHPAFAPGPLSLVFSTTLHRRLYDEVADRVQNFYWTREGAWQDCDGQELSDSLPAPELFQLRDL